MFYPILLAMNVFNLALVAWMAASKGWDLPLVIIAVFALTGFLISILRSVVNWR